MEHDCEECPYFMGITCDDCLVEYVEEELERQRQESLEHELNHWF